MSGVDRGDIGGVELGRGAVVERDGEGTRQIGDASLAATGTGMYPIVPAVLGMLALGERVAPNQLVGIGLLVIGLVTLGAVS